MKHATIIISAFLLFSLIYGNQSRATTDPCVVNTDEPTNEQPSTASAEITNEETPSDDETPSDEEPVSENIETPSEEETPSNEEAPPAETPPSPNPPPVPTTTSHPNILITQVSFKNTANDFLKIKILEDGNAGDGIDLKNFTITDDNVFFTFPTFIAKTNDEITVSMNADKAEIQQNNEKITFTITKSGLTATTEQLILENPEKQIVDTTCWTSGSPTSAEIQDFQNMVQQEGWNESLITSCINSDTFADNDWIERVSETDTNTKNDWKIVEAKAKTADTTPPPNSHPTTINATSNPPSTNIASAIITTSQSTNIQNLTKLPISIISIIPNPTGTDSTDEAITIENTTNKTITIEKFFIDDQEGGSAPYLVNNLILEAFETITFYSKETHINLNNIIDTVRIVNANEQVIESVTYENAKSGWIYTKNAQNIWAWIDTTPVKTPVITKITAKSETKTANPKTNTAKTTTTTKKVAPKKEAYKDGDLSDELIISEFFPNPKGTDTGNEWIEMYNTSDEIVRLGNWKLDDDSKGSKPYIFPDTTSIKAHEYLLISSKESKVILGNTSDEVRLFDPLDTLIDGLKYEHAQEAKSYAKITTTNEREGEKDEWYWTEDVSPGKINPYYEIKEGIIKNIITAINGSQSIEFESEGKTLLIQLGKQDALENTLFQPETKAKFTIMKNTEVDPYILKHFEILESPPAHEENNQSFIHSKTFKWSMLLTLIVITGFLLYKKRKFLVNSQ